MKTEPKWLDGRGVVWAWFLIAIAIALFGCATAPPPPPVVPPSGVYTCVTACARGADLGCQWATPTARGVPCVTVCENFELAGSMSYGVECVTLAPSCDAADRCGGPK